MGKNLNRNFTKEDMQKFQNNIKKLSPSEVTGEI